MSEYYAIPRKSDWNYGGKRWRLSRSKIDLFLECPRCFYLDNKLGLKRPPGFPFSLNSAVDSLLKTEFDVHRTNGEQHALQKQYGIDAIPIAHELLDTWRSNFKGIEYHHLSTGFTISGAIDDLWFDPKTKEYIVVDYKATAKTEAVTALDHAWQDGYKRQMEVYQWLLRQNKLHTSNTGYFVYCTGRPNEQAFNGKLEFDIHLIPYTGSADWIEKTLHEIKAALESYLLPEGSEDCDYCLYRRESIKVEI